ncbi:MAG: AMP-binding protein [Acidobacteriota bacterium]
MTSVDPSNCFFNKSIETLTGDSLREWQNQRLRNLLAEIKPNQFYREKFKARGLEFNDIKTVEDLRALAFTTKSELVAEQAQHPPFGRLLTYPRSRYRYLHQTSGTTGRPLKWLDTAESWQWFVDGWGYVFRGAGVSEDDLIFCAFSFGPYISHWVAIVGGWNIGAMCLAGGGLNSEQRLQTLLDNQCTVLLCTPTYALHLADRAAELGIDLRNSSIRTTIHAGEPGASLPNIRKRIESAWGATCYDHAGATEVGAWAFACAQERAAIHLNEAEFIFEVIDPQSGELLDAGKRGELVITNLGRAAMPVLRYRTGDLVEIIDEPCACGRSFARIKGGVLGRADDMMIVRGVNIYPGAIDDLLGGLANIAEYEVQIRSISGMHDLLIKFEPTDATGFQETSQTIANAFRNRFNIRVSIEGVASGSLPRYEFKARRYKRIAEET